MRNKWDDFFFTVSCINDKWATAPLCSNHQEAAQSRHIKQARWPLHHKTLHRKKQNNKAVCRKEILWWWLIHLRVVCFPNQGIATESRGYSWLCCIFPMNYWIILQHIGPHLNETINKDPFFLWTNQQWEDIPALFQKGFQVLSPFHMLATL